VVVFAGRGAFSLDTTYSAGEGSATEVTVFDAVDVDVASLRRPLCQDATSTAEM